MNRAVEFRDGYNSESFSQLEEMEMYAGNINLVFDTDEQADWKPTSQAGAKLEEKKTVRYRKL